MKSVDVRILWEESVKSCCVRCCEERVREKSEGRSYFSECVRRELRVFSIREGSEVVRFKRERGHYIPSPVF
ncbi:hypothetical protein COLO4_29415 [Corchorus olitorius]|uniref:Uncharacterized protein n=1 Tax=Corchorus olitorius TaxID=93759 RepID=A0A1R3HEK4_9ROSI|nr:hypothetical protein COLO4_29415 [Corchorus olitorius]